MNTARGPNLLMVWRLSPCFWDHMFRALPAVIAVSGPV